MRTSVIFILITAFIWMSCQASGHRDQSWKPKTAKRMKRGRNY